MSIPRSLAILALATWQLACAAPAEPPPLSAAEKANLIRSMQARGLLQDLDVSRCGASSKGAQMQARMDRYMGPDAFDARNCPRQGSVPVSVPMNQR